MMRDTLLACEPMQPEQLMQMLLCAREVMAAMLCSAGPVSWVQFSIIFLCPLLSWED